MPAPPRSKTHYHPPNNFNLLDYVFGNVLGGCLGGCLRHFFLINQIYCLPDPIANSCVVLLIVIPDLLCVLCLSPLRPPPSAIAYGAGGWEWGRGGTWVNMEIDGGGW